MVKRSVDQISRDRCHTITHTHTHAHTQTDTHTQTQIHTDPPMLCHTLRGNFLAIQSGLLALRERCTAYHSSVPDAAKGTEETHSSLTNRYTHTDTLTQIHSYRYMQTLPKARKRPTQV